MATPSEPVGQRGSRGVWVAIIARLLEPLEPLEPGAVGGDRGWGPGAVGAAWFGEWASIRAAIVTVMTEF
jgi:hypothetical protein